MSYDTERYANDPEHREHKKRYAAEWYANNKERRRDSVLQKNFGISFSFQKKFKLKNVHVSINKVSVAKRYGCESLSVSQ